MTCRDRHLRPRSQECNRLSSLWHMSQLRVDRQSLPCLHSWPDHRVSTYKGNTDNHLLFPLVNSSIAHNIKCRVLLGLLDTTQLLLFLRRGCSLSGLSHCPLRPHHRQRHRAHRIRARHRSLCTSKVLHSRPSLLLILAVHRRHSRLNKHTATSLKHGNNNSNNGRRLPPSRLSLNLSHHHLLILWTNP